MTNSGKKEDRSSEISPSLSGGQPPDACNNPDHKSEYAKKPNCEVGTDAPSIYDR